MKPTREQFEQVLKESPNATLAELGQRLGLSTKQASLAMQSYGLKTIRATGVLRVPREDLEKALQDYPGISIRCLAELLGFSRSVVERSLAEHGLKTDDYGAGKQRVERAYQRGFDTPMKMGRELGISEGAARRWMVLLQLWNSELAGLPSCRVCGDLVQQGNGTWEGWNDLHHTCAEYERRQTVAYHLYADDDEIL